MAEFLELCCNSCVCWTYCCAICTIAVSKESNESKSVQTATPLRTITSSVANHESNIIYNSYSKN